MILTFTFTQIQVHNYFLSFKGADRLFESKLQLEACINDIRQWMVFNELKLNQYKTDLLNYPFQVLFLSVVIMSPCWGCRC